MRFPLIHVYVKRAPSSNQEASKVLKRNETVNGMSSTNRDLKRLTTSGMSKELRGFFTIGLSLDPKNGSR